MNLTDVPNLSDGSTPLKVPTNKSKKLGFGRHFSKVRGGYFGKIDMKWVDVARFGVKMGGNESHEVQDHF